MKTELKFLRRFLEGPPENRRAFGERLKVLNKALAAVTLGLVVLIVLDVILISPKREWRKRLAHFSGSESRSEWKALEKGFSEGREPFEGYWKDISSKNIFSASPIHVHEQLAADSSLNNFTLVGILSGENPQAILEDKTAQMTYYLGKNQTANGITVEEIKDRKVVVRYKGETITFAL